MNDYSWPAHGDRLAERAAQCWPDTLSTLPIGSRVTGEVIGRRRFGVFVRINEAPGAMGLAELTSMPRDATLPAVGTAVQGTVIEHAAHNHQVRLRLLPR
ncbi:RNA-binding protein [Paractinoplanes maris]|uniref:RNA-binding protein n=1 Tax=Paractinoplanes maris TaxID=1734446 RepID=UPI002020D4B7|nr:RNA-binding protein [Actinoplanes maris]